MESTFIAELINATKFKLGSSAGFAWLVSSVYMLLVVTLYPKGIVLWMSVYQLSPTIPGEKKAKNPMPRASNPDPKGLLMKAAENRVENEVKGNVSVSELLSKSKTPDEQEA